MSAPELLLHVGFQQTGATMLRRALERVRPQLHGRGIGVIGHAALHDLPDAAGGWRCGDRTDASARAGFERGVARLVEREVRAVRRSGGEPRTLVVTSDHLLGRRNLDERDEQSFRPHAVASVQQMIRAVGPSRVRVVLYLRRQDRLMEACHLRALQQGSTRSFAQRFPRHLEPVLDYRELIDRLAAIPEVDAVRVQPFERVGATASRYLDDLLSALDLPDPVDLEPVGRDLAPYRLYSHRAARLASEVNPHLETAEERRLVRSFLLEHFGATDDVGTRFLSSDVRQHVLTSYAAVNRRLFTAHLPDLDPEGYADDARTRRLAVTHRRGPARPAPRRRRGRPVVRGRR